MTTPYSACARSDSPAATACCAASCRKKNCLCNTIQPQTARSRFCLVMFDTEPMKPNNTGRLIADILPQTEAFGWSRTEPNPALLAAVAHPDY
nr:DTW domain-containing protein YfiP [Candidatus Pantoea persica]